jgi:hypothetical protein
MTTFREVLIQVDDIEVNKQRFRTRDIEGIPANVKIALNKAKCANPTTPGNITMDTEWIRTFDPEITGVQDCSGCPVINSCPIYEDADGIIRP